MTGTLEAAASKVGKRGKGDGYPVQVFFSFSLLVGKGLNKELMLNKILVGKELNKELMLKNGVDEGAERVCGKGVI